MWRSTTYFIDDFTFDKEQYEWIEDQIDRSLSIVYNSTDWFTQIDGDKGIGIIDKSQDRVDTETNKKKREEPVSKWNAIEQYSVFVSDYHHLTHPDSPSFSALAPYGTDSLVHSLFSSDRSALRCMGRKPIP